MCWLRGKVLSPNEIWGIAERVVSKIGGRIGNSWHYSGIWDSGYINGSPIYKASYFGNPNAQKVHLFWERMENEKLKKIKGDGKLEKTRLFLAVMLLILGDKNAIGHC